MKTQDRMEAVTHACQACANMVSQSPSIRGVQFGRCPHQGHWHWNVFAVTLTVENRMDLLGIPWEAKAGGKPGHIARLKNGQSEERIQPKRNTF